MRKRIKIKNLKKRQMLPWNRQHKSEFIGFLLLPILYIKGGKGSILKLK
ncbi:hypothetical protein B4135_3559 [Caldibacillus debilis]|uniref:Uncharacterized protein n=1 Tax=Caldibacillus debilis TaxID=301148 RepID=A0A150LDP4_9BACI|nr:hypothetical protein B4135_3559 [Caldibacillus debilis]